VNGGYNEVAVSDVIHIGPQLTLSAKITRPAGDDREQLEVTYKLNSGDLTTGDWFGLFRSEEHNNKSYIALRYVQELDLPSKNVTFTFVAPRKPGDYVIRFFPKRCRYTHVLQSNSVRVENRDNLAIELIKDKTTDRPVQVRVKWQVHSVDVTKSDYVAIYKLNALNNSYISYDYVDLNKGTVELPAPPEIDTYEVRFHSAQQGKYADVCRSQKFEIPNTDSVTAEVASGIVTVTWKIFSQPKSSWDWVGLFAVGANNSTFVAYKYIDTAANALVFEVPKDHGVYEARYFSNALGKYADFRKSSQFHVA
jgi:hypothetical protein